MGLYICRADVYMYCQVHFFFILVHKNVSTQFNLSAKSIRLGWSHQALKHFTRSMNIPAVHRLIFMQAYSRMNNRFESLERYEANKNEIR